jgi:P-type E1-E2 ATPase
MNAMELSPGQLVLVEAGDIIPSDGEVVQGVASVNEAAITGESAPIIQKPVVTVRGNRRYPGAFRLDQSAYYSSSRFNLPHLTDRTF